jgi:hypothetical protein
MPIAKDGSKHHSFGRASLHDSMAADKAEPVKKMAGGSPGRAMAKDSQPNPDAELPEESPEDIHDVVAEHGPAVEIHSHHDHEAGMHHVTSHHGEHKHGHEDGAGFTHHSKHATHEDAHRHMGHALGVSAEHEKSESPEFEAGEHEGAMEGIPGLKG